jgi:predicted acetyltransferase
MDEIKLIMPSLEYGEDIFRFRQELIEANDVDSFAGCRSLKKCDNIMEYLDILSKWTSVSTCPAGCVPCNTYIAVRVKDNRIVGIIDLRHHIDHPILGLWGGHIGYTVRPFERGKGIAKEMLRLNLKNCRERNIEKVMITCSCDNLASEKVIVSNGGVFEKEVIVDGEHIKRYRITL